MRLGYLLLAKMAHAESGFDEDITLQQENYKTVADLAPSLPIFNSIGIDESNDGSNLDLTESSGTLHPGQFDQVDEPDGSNEQVAVIFTEIDKIVDRANIVVPPASDEATSLESRSNMHNSRNRQNKGNNKQQQQILDELVEIEDQLEERQLTEIVDEEENTMIIAIAAGVGCLLMLSILTTVACCISRKRARRRQESTREKHRRVEANPAEQTFERLDFTHASTGTSKRQKKLAESTKQTGAEGDVTSSEIAPSSMGTLRTYIDRSNTTMVKNCLAGNESDFRNTSSDIDSIESSNPPKKIINHVIAEKKKYSGYQELATRDRSNYSSSSTASSCEHVMGIGAPPVKPATHHVIMEEGAPPAYETITRSRDSVIDL